jgi:hypothetical protein
MTEEEWLTNTDPLAMVRFLRELPPRDRISDRKLRLFACACCRKLEKYVEPICVESIVRWERLADEGVRKTDYPQALGDAYSSLRGPYTEPEPQTPEYLGSCCCLNLNWDTKNVPASVDAIITDTQRAGIEYAELARMLRDVVGNPCRRVVTKRTHYRLRQWRAWNEGTVVRLAQSMYDSRCFDEMPILHDALSDAGCDNLDILEHCRTDGGHIRGCWVVDLLLKKK